MMRASADRTRLSLLQPGAQLLYIPGGFQACLFYEQLFAFLTKFIDLFIQRGYIDSFQFFFQTPMFLFCLYQRLLFTGVSLLQTGKLLVQRYYSLPDRFTERLAVSTPDRAADAASK